MWPVSSAYLEAIQSPHQVVVRADVDKGGVRLYSDLPVVSGSVSVDTSRITRRECSLVIAPRLRDGVYGDRPALPESPGAPLGHYGQEITLRHGLVYPNGVVEWVPIGVYRIDDVDGSLLDQSGVQIRGVSREAWISDHRFPNPRTVSSHSAQQLITDLIQETDPAFVVVPSATQDARVRRTTFDEDRWDAITQIARGIGAVVYADAAGRFVIRDAPTLDSTAVWRITSAYSTREQRTVVAYDWTGARHDSTSTRTTDVETLTNLVTNPRGRTTSGTVTVRENLSTNTIARGSVTLTQDVSFDGDVWTQVDVATNSHGTRTNGTTSAVEHTFAAEVANPGATTVRVSIDVGDSGTIAHDLAPGERRVFSTTAIPAQTSFCGDLGARAGETFLFRVPTCEVGTSAIPLFNGALSPDSDLTAQWTGTAGASASELVGPAPVGYGSFSGTVVYHSAKHDAVAIHRPSSLSSAATLALSASDGDAGTFVVDYLAPEGGTQWIRIGGAVSDGGVEAAATIPGEWVTIRRGYSATGGDINLEAQNRSGEGSTIYTRWAVIEGTDTYDGPVWDGDTPNVIDNYTVDHPGVLISADETSSRERVYNKVVTRGENPASGARPVAADATDDDPTSPTRFGAPSTGAYGRVTKFQSIPTITTVAQARRAAAAELARSTGAASSVDVAAVPNVALEGWDVIDLWTDPSNANTIRRHVVDSIDFDLSAGGGFQMSTRDIRQVVA